LTALSLLHRHLLPWAWSFHRKLTERSESVITPKLFITSLWCTGLGCQGHGHGAVDLGS
jgi:hypothetical protein